MLDRGGTKPSPSSRSSWFGRSLLIVWHFINNICVSSALLNVYLLSFVVQLVSSPFSEGITPNVAVDLVCLWEEVSSNYTIILDPTRLNFPLNI